MFVRQQRHILGHRGNFTRCVSATTAGNDFYWTRADIVTYSCYECVMDYVTFIKSSAIGFDIRVENWTNIERHRTEFSHFYLSNRRRSKSPLVLKK